MVMKDGAKEVARDTALHITLVTTTAHEVRMDVTEAAVIHIWSKSKISGEIYFSYANYTRQNLFIDSDLKKPIRRKPKGAVAQAQGRIKRQLEQAQAQREQAAKVPKKEQISVNVNDIVEELKIQDESGEVSTRLKEDLWNLLLKNKIQNL